MASLALGGLTGKQAETKPEITRSGHALRCVILFKFVRSLRSSVTNPTAEMVWSPNRGVLGEFCCCLLGSVRRVLRKIELALDDKFDDIKKLIDAGKEKGYLTYDQVNDLIPHDVHSPEDLEDLLTHDRNTRNRCSRRRQDAFERSGKKIRGSDEASEDVELDLTPGALEKTNDPVRMYLREMGTVRCSRAKAKWKSPSASRAGKTAS